MKIAICALFVHSVAEFFSVVLYSDYTPPSLVSQLSASIAHSSLYHLSMISIEQDLTSSLDSPGLTAVFDLSYSVAYKHKIEALCSERHLICFSRHPQDEQQKKWVFGLHPSPLTRAKAIQTLLDQLDWDKYHLIASQDPQSAQIFQFLSHDPLFVLSSRVDQELYDLHIGREVKPTGNWKLVALTDSQGGSKVIQGLKNLRIFKERCGLIISAEGSAGQFDTGTIVVSEEGLGFSKTQEEYQINSVFRALDILYKVSQNGSIKDKHRLRDLLEQNSKDHSISNSFSILNYRPELAVVGNITDRAYISALIFPGNVTELNTTPPIINISGNLGLYNYDNSFSVSAYLLNPGILPMIDIINSDDSILSNFVLEIHGTDCGPSRFDYEYVSECMQKHISSLGVFYIDSSIQDVAEGNIKVFRENGIIIPHTGILYEYEHLYDKEEFPELFIPTARWYHAYQILPYILNSFRWKEILFYCSGDLDMNSYEIFIKNTEVLEIEIKNQIRRIPVYFESTFMDANEEVLKEAVNSKCRIFVVLLAPNNFLLFMESLYKVGLRKGDTVVITINDVANIIDSEELYGHDKKKVLEIVDGSLSLVNVEYTGEYGKNLKKQIADLISPLSTAYTCFQIDALLLGVYTIDLMLDIGRNFEDPLDMNYFMRQIDFTGCSGLLSIDSQGNGRNEIVFSLRNFFVEEGDKWKEEEIGNYTLGITVPLKIWKDIVWPNGSKELPKDKIEEPECGIEESEICENHESIMITVYGTIGYFSVVFLSSLIIWFIYFRLEITEISESTEMMFEDGVEIATPFVEGLQYLALGSGTSITAFLAQILQISHFFELETALFWRIFFVFSFLSLLWIFCLFSAIFLFDRRYPKFLKDFTRYLGLTMSPLISKIGFVVMLWVILRIFECKQGSGESATDSFLKYDCNKRCWEGFHLGLAITSICNLCAFTFFSAISSTTYDEVMNHVHIKTNPSFSFWKSMFKTVVVVLNFHLYDLYPWILNVLYCVLFAVWTIYCFKTKTFNYGRLRMWQTLSSLGVFLHFFLSIIQTLTQYSSFILIYLDLSIIVVLAALGFAIQIKYIPGYLYKKKGRNFGKLLVFAYSSRMDPEDLTKHELDYRIKERVDPTIEIGSRVIYMN